MVNDVKRPKKYEDMLLDLCQKDKDKNKNIFSTYKDALVFAACLGYKFDKRVPFEKTSEPVGIHIFKGEYDSVIWDYIGIASTEDSEIMSTKRFEEKIHIFEEFACGGLELIETKVYSAPGDWRDLIVELIFEQEENSSQSILDDITHLV